MWTWAIVQLHRKNAWVFTWWRATCVFQQGGFGSFWIGFALPNAGLKNGFFCRGDS